MSKRSKFLKTYVALLTLVLLTSCKARNRSNVSDSHSDEFSEQLKNILTPAGLYERSTHYPKDKDRIALLLADLPANFLQSYSLVNDAAGLQEGNDKNPRAIVFSHTGHFIMTFNGSSDLHGYDAVELLNFDNKKKLFELYELVLAPGESAELRGPNPPNCTECHGLSPKPIWEEYPFWPGSYGSQDDILSENAKPTLKVAEGMQGPRKVDANKLKNEIKLFTELYLPNASKNSRYSQLRRPEGFPAFPFSMDYKKSLTFRPNSRLGILFKKLNTERWVAKAKQSPEYGKIRGPFAFELLECQNFGKTWPGSSKKAVSDYFQARGIQSKMNKYRGSFDWNSFSDFYTVLNVTPDDFQLAGRGQGEYHDGLQLQSYLFIRDEIAADLSREQKQAEIAKYPLSLYMQRKKLPVFIDSPFRGFTEFYEQDFRADIDNGEAC